MKDFEIIKHQNKLISSIYKIIEILKKINTNKTEQISSSSESSNSQEKNVVYVLDEFKKNVIGKMKPNKCWWMTCMTILTIAFACNFIFEKTIYKNILVTEQTAIESNTTGTISWKSVTSETNQSNAETNTAGKNNSKSQHKTDKTDIHTKNLSVYKECIALYGVAALLLSIIIFVAFYTRKKMRIYNAANARFQILYYNVLLDEKKYRIEDIQRELKAIALMVEEMQYKRSNPWMFFE